MYTENNQKYVVAINRTCPLWKTYNIVSHLSNALARKMRSREDLCFVPYIGASGTLYGDFPLHPYIVLQAKSAAKLRNIASRARAADLPIVAIIDPMIGHSTEEQVRAAKEAPEDTAEYVGIALYGESTAVDSVTKSLSALNVSAPLNEVIQMTRATQKS